MFDCPSQRPEHFTLNPYSPLSEGLVFAGLGGAGCAGSLRLEDSSGHGKHGTLTNMDPATDWVWNSTLNRWALNFDGTNDYVANQTVVLTRPFSFGCWMTTINRSAYNKFLMSFGYNLAGAILLYCNGGAWQVIGNAASPVWTPSPAVALPDNNVLTHVWLSVVGDDTAYLYVNGELVATSNRGQMTSGNWPTTTPNAAWHLGYALPRALSNSYHGGLIIDPMVYNRALSNSEVQALADPSNVNLCFGTNPLILPPKRRYYRATTTSGPNLSMPFWCASGVAI